MTVYLDEDQVGTDDNTIGYPHLLLCMGVTLLMNDGSLIGAHFTAPSTEGRVSTNLRNVILASTAAPVAMYMTGNFGKHIDEFGGGDYTVKANAIGFHGNVYMFDTATIKPKDGTFVRLTSQGAVTHPAVEYKRNEKVAYTKTVGDRGNVTALNPTLARFHVSGALPLIDSKVGFHTLKDKKWTPANVT